MDIVVIKQPQFKFCFRLFQCCIRYDVQLYHFRRIRGRQSEKSGSYASDKTENKLDSLYNREHNDYIKEFQQRYPSERPYNKKNNFFDNPGLRHVFKSLGTSPEEMAEIDDNDLPDDEEFDDVIMRPREMLAKYEQEMIQQQNQIRRHIIQKKYFKTTPETCLLTCAAKEQIHYLNQIDSAEWSPEKLAQCFPVSVQGVKKLLKNNYVPKNEKARMKHDEKIKQNWNLLLSGDEQQISPITRRLWKEGQLNLQHYGKIPALPFKPVCDSNQHKLLQEPPEGPFLSIIKPYLAFKNKHLSQSTSLQITDNENSNVACSSGSRSVKITVKESSKSASNYPEVENTEDSNDITYFQNDKFRFNEPAVTHDQFKKNLMVSYDKYENKSKVGDNFKEWMKNLKNNAQKQPQCEVNMMENNICHEYVDQYDTNTIELTVDEPASKEGTGVKESFIYDSAKGYQHPLGTKDNAKQKIKIPAHMHKKDAIYKIGNCYYDDSGEFLYKVFT